MSCYCIIVPVYNEEKYLDGFITNLCNSLQSLPEITSVLFMDDGSTDKTLKIITLAQEKYPIIRVSSLGKNEGKGAAMLHGLAQSRNLKVEGVIFMDGDGQHNPADLPEFIKNLKLFPIVFGYRQLKTDTPGVRKIGNHIAGFIIRNIFNIKRHGDILCGYIALRSDVFDKIHWSSKDYGVEAEISAIIGRKKIPFTEVLVDTIYLDYNKGVNLRHAIGIFLHIPYWIYKH